MMYNGETYSGWQAIKYHWKKGTHPRDISLIEGTGYAGFTMQYQVGDGFVMYPDRPWQSAMSAPSKRKRNAPSTPGAMGLTLVLTSDELLRYDSLPIREHRGAL